MNKRENGYIFGRVPTRVLELPNDETQKIKEVSKILRDMVIKSRESRVVRLFAIKLLKSRGIRPKDYIGEITTVYEFVRDKIPYRKDATFLDTFTEPERQIHDYLYGFPSGDCDDKSLLLASLLLTLGHVPRLVLTNNRKGSKYSHIYVEVRDPRTGSWICLETTEPVEMGWCPPTFKRGIITII